MKLIYKLDKKYQLVLSTFVFLFAFLINIVNASDNSFLVSGEIDKIKGEIGDSFQYTLTIDRIAGTKYKDINYDEYFSEFDIIDQKKQPEEIVDNRIIEKNIIIFQANEIGSYIIPEIEIKFVGISGDQSQVKTAKIYLDIISVLKDEKKNDLEPIKDIQNIEVYSSKPIIIALIIFTLIIILVVLFFKFKKPKNTLPTPEEIAKAKINHLKEIKDLNSKEYYDKLSLIIRSYLSKKYNINFLEKFIDEIIKLIKSINDLNKNDKNFLIDFFEESEKIRFTNTESNEKNNQIVIDFLSFIEKNSQKVANDK